jgi:hypothetical protein
MSDNDVIAEVMTENEVWDLAARVDVSEVTEGYVIEDGGADVDWTYSLTQWRTAFPLASHDGSSWLVAIRYLDATGPAGGEREAVKDQGAYGEGNRVGLILAEHSSNLDENDEIVFELENTQDRCLPWEDFERFVDLLGAVRDHRQNHIVRTSQEVKQR